MARRSFLASLPAGAALVLWSRNRVMPVAHAEAFAQLSPALT